MNKNIVEILNIYKKFFKILIDYARVNISFSITYVSLLMLDSFAKIFSVISMAPLVELLSGDNVGTQQITLFFKDALSWFGFEYTLGSSIAVFIFGSSLGLLTEIFLYSVSRRNPYKLQYNFIFSGF